MTRLIRHHIALAVFFLSLVVAWAVFPAWRGFWMNEDQWIEWASFLFFAAAAFVLLLRVSPFSYTSLTLATGRLSAHLVGAGQCQSKHKGRHLAME